MEKSLSCLLWGKWKTSVFSSPPHRLGSSKPPQKKKCTNWDGKRRTLKFDVFCTEERESSIRIEKFTWAAILPMDLCRGVWQPMYLNHGSLIFYVFLFLPEPPPPHLTKITYRRHLFVFFLLNITVRFCCGSKPGDVSSKPYFTPGSGVLSFSNWLNNFLSKRCCKPHRYLSPPCSLSQFTPYLKCFHPCIFLFALHRAGRTRQNVCRRFFGRSHNNPENLGTMRKLWKDKLFRFPLGNRAR